MSRKTERPQPDQEYDHMSLDVKRGKAEKFRHSCEDFGWQQVERRADRRYADIVHLRFRRPHAIANKDALQLLQVRLEIAWNTIGRCESALSARTAAFAVVGGIPQRFQSERVRIAVIDSLPRIRKKKPDGAFARLFQISGIIGKRNLLRADSGSRRNNRGKLFVKKHTLLCPLRFSAQIGLRQQRLSVFQSGRIVFKNQGDRPLVVRFLLQNFCRRINAVQEKTVGNGLGGLPVQPRRRAAAEQENQKKQNRRSFHTISIAHKQTNGNFVTKEFITVPSGG